MDAAAVVEDRARSDVAALGPTVMSSTRTLQDIEVEALVRHARRVIRGIMRDVGMLRPWWDRSPLLILAAPAALTWAAIFGDPLALFAGGVLLAWGAVAEPRMNRAERREMVRLLRLYRHAAAEALYTMGDRKYRGSAGAAGFGSSP